MADSVARVRILAQIEGLEGFDKLKGAFKGLQQAIGPADAELAKARKEILAFGDAGAKSQQVIKGQVEALKALQAQATIGSTVYRQLGKDIKALGGAYQEAATGVKQFSDAQLRSQIVGSKPSTFEKQIAALKRGLQDLSVYGRQYTEALTEIQRRQIPFNTALGRQNVIAGAEAYAQGGKGGSALPELPNTTAALNQRLGELNAELVNLSRGGTDWIRVSREIASVQRQLNQEFANPAVEAARRRLEQSRNVSSGFLEFSTGLEDRIAVQRSIERNQRRREAEAAARSGPMQGPPAPSELFQGIAGISNQTASNQLQLMGRSYQDVANSIRQTSAASDGSLSSLQRQRAAWEQLRATISPLDKEYAQIEREARKAINTIDGQIGKRQIGGRGGAAQIGQGLGAVAASGIFGGPEGFLGSAGGALIGGLIGGPAGLATGAFIGGSVGAYGGMARQGLGGMSTYAADISKQEIALKGITKTQQEYARALAASAAVTRDFNVPQLEATRGMTQLSAAVIGAGGKVADAEVVFRNVTAAIKASGGTSEDVQGALTALGQIFSKGKVSAEELQGQLGERLPGAVTMFAKATGRTLPQLQKDLEQGVVGLADLMKFITSDQGLGQFEQRAKAVADSSAEAGARLTTTWNDTKRAIGEVLLPLGAQIQDSLAKALREATPALVEFAKGAATLIKLFVDNAGLIGSVLKTLLGFGAVAGAAIGVTQLAAAVASLTALTAGLTGLGGAMGVATLAAESLGIAIAAVPGIGWIAAGATALGLLTVELYNNNDAFRTWANNLATVISTDFKNAWDNAVSIVSSATGAIVDIWNGASSLLSSVGSGIATAFDDLFGGIFGRILQYWNSLPEPVRRAMSKGASSAVGGLLAPGNPAVGYVAGAAVRAGQMGPNAQGSAMFGRYDVAGGKTDLQTSLPGQLTNWQIQQEQEKEKSRQDAERAAAQQQQLNESIAKARIALSDAQFRHDQELARKRYEYEIELDQKRRDNWVKMQTGAARSAAGMVSGFFGEIDTLLDKLRQGKEQVEAAAQKSQSAAAMAAVTVIPGPIATSTGGNAMGLKEGSAVPGPPAAVWNGGRGVAMRSGAAAAARRDVSAEGSAAVAAADLAAAEEGLKLVEGQFGNLLELLSKSFVLDFTDQIRQQNAALRDSAEITGLRNKLELEGQRPELIENEVKKAEAIQRVNQENATNTNKLIEAKAILEQLQSAKKKDIYAIEAQKGKVDTLSSAISSNNDNLQEFIRLTNEATTAQIAFNDALRFRQDDRIGLGLREGAQQYVESIGTMREATAQLAQTGIKGVEDAIFSLVTTGTANFREFAASILKDTARMIIQQLILRTIMQAIGAIGGGGGFGKGYFDPITGKGVAGPNFGLAMGGVIGRNGLQPFAMGGIVTKPTLFRYANGGVPGMGLMGEAGPEAIIPLRRGRDGKLGVAGGGNSTNVTVNVDASGSSVQGNAGQGEALGRAISQAVQQELIKQRRPGGLLAA